LILGKSKLIDQLPERSRLLQGIEVFAVKVLDNRLFQRVGVIDWTHDHWHGGKSGLARRPPASLSRNELVTTLAGVSHQKRLKYPNLTN
jgi:hypothetical protein